MSNETMGWLARYVVAGFRDTREPWWAKYAEAEGWATNLFPADVPMEKVHELLTSWSPIEAGLYDVDMDRVQTLYDADMKPVQAITLDAIDQIDTHKLLKASDTRERMTVIGIDHAIHTYRNWLTGTVQECVGDEAKVSSAGLLRRRAQAWVTIERPETAVGPDGIRFSPFITLSTSYDGSLTSQINQNTQLCVCDNTVRIARTQGLSARVRHTKNSERMLGTYRGVMTAIMQGETDFREELERQLSVQVDDNAFSRFLEAFVPIDEEDIPAKKTRSERKRQEITQLYRGDDRVAAWRGTEFGVVQAVNTWQTHMSQLRNMTGWELDDVNLRAMRLYGERLRPVKGESADQATAKLLEAVL